MIGSLRIGIRRAARRPLTSLVIVGLLAIAIGMNASVFAVIRAVALGALPYPDAGRLVVVGLAPPSCRVCVGAMPRALLSAEERFSHSVDAWGAFAHFDATLELADRVRPVNGAVLTARTLQLLGARPQLGRLLAGDPDDRVGGPLRVVLSAHLWRGAFGAASDIVGRTIVLDHRAYEVVGVLSPEFGLPESSVADLYVGWGAPIPNGEGTRFTVIGRLATGASAETASAELTAIANSIGPVGATGEPRTVSALALRVALAVERGSELAVLQGLALLVLVVACTNVAGLLVSRAQAERHAGGLRIVLGARPIDVLKASAADVFPLVLAGCGLGLVGATWAAPFVKEMMRASVPAWAAVGVTGGVVTVALGCSVVCAGGIALLPVRDAFGGNLQAWIQEGSAGMRGGRRGSRSQRALVTAQLGIAMTLLAAAGLLVANYAGIQWDASTDAATKSLSAEVRGARGGPPLTAVEEVISGALRRTPGVARAYFTSNVVLGLTAPNDVYVDGGTTPLPAGAAPSRGTKVMAWDGGPAAWRPTTGRFFTTTELREHASDVVVLSAALAARIWPGRDPIGRTIRFAAVSGGAGWRRVIGVVPDPRIGEAVVAGGIPAPPRFYVPFAGNETSALLVVNTDRPAEPMIDSVAHVIERVAPNAMLPIRYDGEAARVAFAQARDRTLLLALLSGMAVLLSIVGTAALVAYSTSLRVREFGIRAALGASRAAIAWQVVTDALRLSATGLGLGAVGSAVGIYLIVPAVYFHVRVLNWPAVALLGLLMLALTLSASLASVVRALHVDPAVVLRND